MLRRLQASLKADEQVVAVYLYGSLGRGDGDALSDPDLWILLDDQAVPKMMRERPAYASRGAQPLAVVEAPQNAPRGGAYQLALYPDKTGPQQVDWYWQPASLAEARTDRRVLFDRREDASLPATPLPVEGNAEVALGEEEELRNRISLFWAMLLIQAKHLAQNP